MSIRFNFIVWLAFIIFSCNKPRDTNATDEICGAYTREYSFKVINQETGVEIGMRTIRDTIFIRQIGNEFQVSNKKWRLNNYDKDGWRNMEHDDDRPKATYLSAYVFTNKSLAAENHPTLYIDTSPQMVYWTIESKYRKIEN
ncbi:MAG: hypothetical protein JSS79_17845 [Bacteroidetes bacterium]|nr:hypothetical protein [Bacteroidota bacterium]